MIVVIQCRDQVGLVAAISGFLSNLQINIVSMREFVDVQATRFFARLELTGVLDSQQVEKGLQTILPEGAEVDAKTGGPKRAVVLVTKEHHCLSDLLIRNHFKTTGIQIECVIGNYVNLADICTRFGVPFFHVSHEEKSKAEFESEILSHLKKHKVDLLVLAKFMRVLSPEFVARFPLKIVNIHHSFLPAFIGANPYRQAYERGVKLIGATSHFVTNDLDEGPILTQQIIPVDHSYNAAEMMKSGKEIETAVLNRALRLLAEDRVLVYQNKTVIFE